MKLGKSISLLFTVAIKPLLFGAVLFLTLSCVSNSQNNFNDMNNLKQTNGIAKYQYFEDTDMWNHIFSLSPAFVIPKNISPTAIIIPHHDIAVDRQNSFYKALSEQIQPSVIVIVSPDHFELGKKLITLPKETTFMAPDGNLLIDNDSIKNISTDERISDVVSLQDDLWFQEHGIFIHSPFLKHYFPNAKVIPILVKMLSTETEFNYYKELADVLSEQLPEDTLFISSVDCSHYQIPKMTSLHDSVTKNTIQFMEDSRFAEIDSPESIAILYEFCRKRNACNPVLIDRSSTFDYIPRENIESTSHQYWTFYSDEINNHLQTFYKEISQTNQRFQKKPEHKRLQTILIAGSGKTGAGIRKTWIWDRYKNSKNEADILLRNAAGKEARFFYGFDALIFDPEPLTVYERKLHETTLQVFTYLQSDLQKIFSNQNERLNISNTEENPCIKILEIVHEENGTELPSKTQISTLLKTFDVVVTRDDNGVVPAKAFLFSDKNSNTFETFNLGICHGKNHIEGSLLAIDFNGENIQTEMFSYESNNGIVPAINQFIPIEE